MEGKIIIVGATGYTGSSLAKLLIEPINTYDIPGFFLSTTAQGIAILDEVGADNAFLQYDIYHAQRMEGELANTMQKHLARIGHMQLADNPGRNEPGTGEINYAFLFKFIFKTWNKATIYSCTGRSRDDICLVSRIQHCWVSSVL